MTAVLTESVSTTCGHDKTPAEVRGIGSGYARFINPDGTEDILCYPCADARQRDAIKENPTTPFVAYLSGDAKTVTTWTGGELGRVTHVRMARGGFYGSKIYRVWAVTPDGLEWFGLNGGPGAVIKLKPVNRKTQP